MDRSALFLDANRQFDYWKNMPRSESGIETIRDRLSPLNSVPDVSDDGPFLTARTLAPEVMDTCREPEDGLGRTGRFLIKLLGVNPIFKRLPSGFARLAPGVQLPRVGFRWAKLDLGAHVGVPVADLDPAKLDPMAILASLLFHVGWVHNLGSPQVPNINIPGLQIYDLHARKFTGLLRLRRQDDRRVFEVVPLDTVDPTFANPVLF